MVFFIFRTLSDARKAFFINVPLTLSLTSLVSFSGLALYAHYSTCDPIKAGKIKSYDMIMPYFAKQQLTKFPGLAGLFVSGMYYIEIHIPTIMDIFVINIIINVLYNDI